ncbi:MAG: C25 family cysteine peptidase, partial [Candidatus Thermoplasmatota archaeon]|nr:C25 family cysteine peptidase [Candidatus Thermoplasmatota archaeon]
YVYNSLDEAYYISELYYADIYDKNGDFSSWDTNNNRIFGEWNGTEAQDKDIDLYPDVYVGRLACRNLLEVNIMVDKIITYETSTYGSDWFNRIVVCAGDTYPNGQYPFPTPDFEGEKNAKTVLSYMPGFSNTSLFTSDGSFTGPSDIINAVNQGCGFLFFDGHGNPMVWSSHPSNNKTWINGLRVGDMIYLKNKNMLPVCVVSGCHNLQLDVNLLNLLKDFKEAYYWSIWTPECWGWKLTRKIGGGSIATIGCSGLGMSKEDKSSLEGASDYLDPQFFYEYGINGTDILGECWGKAINRYLNRFPIDWNTPSSWDYAYDAKTVQQWVLLGDPSLKIGGYSS